MLGFDFDIIQAREEEWSNDCIAKEPKFRKRNESGNYYTSSQPRRNRT